MIVENEIGLLLLSITQQLMKRVNDAKDQGEDLLEQMTQNLDQQIENAEAKFEKLRKEHGKIHR